jgi:hypothetical protein
MQPKRPTRCQLPRKIARTLASRSKRSAGTQMVERNEFAPLSRVIAACPGVAKTVLDSGRAIALTLDLAADSGPIPAIWPINEEHTRLAIISWTTVMPRTTGHLPLALPTVINPCVVHEQWKDHRREHLIQDSRISSAQPIPTTQHQFQLSQQPHFGVLTTRRHFDAVWARNSTIPARALFPSCIKPASFPA